MMRPTRTRTLWPIATRTTRRTTTTRTTRRTIPARPAMLATRTTGTLPGSATAWTTRWTTATRTAWRTSATRTARTIATGTRTTTAWLAAIGTRRAGAITRSLARTTRLAGAAWTTTIARRCRCARDHPAWTRARHFAARWLFFIRRAIPAARAFSAPETHGTAAAAGLAAIAAGSTALAAATFVTTAAASLHVRLQIDDVVELADLGRAFHFGVAGEDAHETHAIGLVTDGAERFDEPREAVTG
jgi:hypothetical protein